MKVSIIIPTYNEALNLPLLVEEIFSNLDRARIDAEIIFVDDASPDGTGAVAEDLKKKYPIQVIHRSGKLGLGSAVIEGFALSNRPYVGVMDADLSHDPKILNDLIFSLEQQDVAIGSRFSPGSSVEKWKWWRKLVSNVGVFFASKLTKVKDPLSGYFFIKKSILDGVNLETKGYKILLEILVKARYTHFKEIPFVFRIRKFSTSKLNYSEYFLFFGQIAKYSLYKVARLLQDDKSSLYFIGLLLLGLFLLLYRVSARSFWMDEQAVLEYMYQNPNPIDFLRAYFKVPDNHPPLYYLLVIISYKLFAAKELGIRLVSMVSGLGILITVYYFSVLLFKDKVLARWTVFLTSISSYFLLISQMARYHSLSGFLMLVSLFYFCKIILQGYEKKSFIKFLIFAALLGYADMPHFIYEVVLVNLYYFYTLIRTTRVMVIKQWFLGQAALATSFLPIVYLFYLRIFKQHDKGFEKASLLGRSLIDKVSDFLIHFYSYFFGENILPWNWVVFGLGVVTMITLLFFLVRGLYRKNFSQPTYLLLYLFFSSIILNVLFLNYANPRYNFIVYPKYVFVAFPLFIMLVSTIAWQVKNRIGKYFILGAMVVVSLCGLYNFYQSAQYINGSYFNGFKGYEFVKNNARTGDYLIINGDAGIGLYDFYKDTYFQNLTPINLEKVFAGSIVGESRFWFFTTGSDGDSAYESAGTSDKIPNGFVVVDTFQSVPTDPTLLKLKQRLTGRQSYDYKYAVYLLTLK